MEANTLFILSIKLTIHLNALSFWNFFLTDKPSSRISYEASRFQTLFGFHSGSCKQPWCLQQKLEETEQQRIWRKKNNTKKYK